MWYNISCLIHTREGFLLILFSCAEDMVYILMIFYQSNRVASQYEMFKNWISNIIFYKYKDVNDENYKIITSLLCYMEKYPLKIQVESS